VRSGVEPMASASTTADNALRPAESAIFGMGTRPVCPQAGLARRNTLER
jgi:hypothetical protein